MRRTGVTLTSAVNVTRKVVDAKTSLGRWRLMHDGVKRVVGEVCVCATGNARNIGSGMSEAKRVVDNEHDTSNIAISGAKRVMGKVGEVVSVHDSGEDMWEAGGDEKKVGMRSALRQGNDTFLANGSFG